MWFAARVLEDARSAAQIEYEQRRVSVSSAESDDSEPARPQRMSYAGPLPDFKPRANDWKRRTAPVGMGLGPKKGSGMFTPPLSPKTPAQRGERAGSPTALIGAAMLGQAGPTPPPSTAGSPTPFSALTSSSRSNSNSARPTSTPPRAPRASTGFGTGFGRSVPTPSPVSSAASSPAPSPSSAAKARPWEKRLSGLSAAPERSDSLASTASAASSITTYSYDVQVVRAARVSTHEGVLASPVLGQAASLTSRPSSLTSRPSSLSASTTRASVPPSIPAPPPHEGDAQDTDAEDSFLAYLNPGAPADELEPILEIIKPAPPPEPGLGQAAEMLWLVENISGHQFYVPDADVIAVPEAEHRRLRAQETRHFWPVYASQLEFLALRRKDIRRRHRVASASAARAARTADAAEGRALLVEFTDRYEYMDLHDPPLPGQHEAALSAAFRALRRAEGLPAEDVVLDAGGHIATLRTAEQVAGLLRGGWFECDDEFWEDARAAC